MKFLQVLLLFALFSWQLSSNAVLALRTRKIDAASAETSSSSTRPLVISATPLLSDDEYRTKVSIHEVMSGIDEWIKSVSHGVGDGQLLLTAQCIELTWFDLSCYFLSMQLLIVRV